MKKIVSVILGICILVMNTFSPIAADVAVETVEQVYFYSSDGYISEINIPSGGVYFYNYTYYPEDVAFDSWRWYSTDETIATILTDYGVIYGEKLGTAYIIVENEYGQQIGSLKVNVLTDDHFDDGYSNGKDETGADGEITDGKDETGADGEITDGKDENDNIVDADGDGKPDIDGEGDVAVSDWISFIDNETGMPTNELYLNIDDTYWLEYTVKDGVDINDVYFTTTDGYVAWIDADCGIYACNVGVTYVVAYSKDMELGRLKVTVSSGNNGDDDEGGNGESGSNGDANGDGKPDGGEYPDVSDIPTGITFYEKDIVLSVGDEYFLSYYLYPDNASSDKLIWSVVSAPSEMPVQGDIITVDNGVVSALNPGYATVEVYNTNNDYLGYCNIEVLQPKIEMTDLTLNKQELTLKIYEEEKLEALITPDNAECEGLYWYSDNSNIAWVDNSGYVYAEGVGSTYIYVCTYDGYFSASCYVTVEPVYVTSISLTSESLELFVGEYEYVDATVYPSDATQRNITWSSSDTAVATVSSYGKITARGEGTATITATAQDGSGVYAECKVTVNSKAVKGVSLNKTELNLGINETETLIATVEPSYAENTYVYWSSDNEDVAYVNSWSGKVTAKAEGEATITVTTEDGGFTAECKVTVSRVPVTGITLDNENMQINLYESAYLTASILPNNASNQNVIWQSSDTNVATVYTNGYVYGSGEGEATITATTEDGGFVAECKVTVSRVPVTGVSFETEELEIELNKRTYLPVVIEPANATNKNVTYTSSHPTVLWFRNGENSAYVEAYAVGTTYVTATTEDGSYTATIKVTVPEVPPTGVTLSETSLKMSPGEGKRITATIEPSNTTSYGLIWQSSDESVVTVDGGWLYAVGEGTATVSVITKDGGFEATCDITVAEIAVEGVSLSKEYIAYTRPRQSTDIRVNITPANAANREVIWTSSDESVAYVDGYYGDYYEGNLLLKSYRVQMGKAGKATLTATTVDGGFVASCEVVVYISLEPSVEYAMQVGETLTPVVHHTEHVGGYQLSVSDTDIADFENGVLVAKKEGTVTLKVTGGFGDENYAHGDCMDECEIRISESSGSLADGITYQIDGNTLIISGTGALNQDATSNIRVYDWGITNIVIEEGITEIGNSAFGGNWFDPIESVSIPDSVTKIGDYAFHDCDGITEITIGKNITEIGELAFADMSGLEKINYNAVNASLKMQGYASSYAGISPFRNNTWFDESAQPFDIVFGDTVEVIPKYLSEYVNFKSVTLGNNIKIIGDHGLSYQDCLTDIVLPATIEDITGAFVGCSNISSYTIPEGNQYYATVNGVLFNADKTTLLEYPSKKTDDEFVIPDTVKTINTFNENKYIKAVTIGEAVTKIYGGAFEGCTSLNKIVWNAVNVEDMSEYGTFDGTDVEIYFGENVERIPAYAFTDYSYYGGYSGLDISKIFIHEKLNEIGMYAFYYCNIDTLNYYGSYEQWNDITVGENGYPYSNNFRYNYAPSAFENGYEYCIKNDEAYIISYANEITGSSFTIADTLGGYPVKVIGEGTFKNYEYIDELVVPEGVRELEDRAFAGINAKKVVLPSTITKIGLSAVTGQSLKEISVSANNTHYCSVDGILFNKDKTVLIKYPAAKQDELYVAPSEVEMLSNGAFEDCGFIKEVKLGNNVTNIGYNAFAACTSLEKITIPASVTQIGYFAFFYADSLTDVYYGGTEERWNSIDIMGQNDALNSATKHYGDVPVDKVYLKMGETDYDYNRFYYDVYLNDIEPGVIVAIAYYYEGKLVYKDFKTYNGEDYLSFERNYSLGTIDCVKAMVWKNLTSLKPVCTPAVMNLTTD